MLTLKEKKLLVRYEEQMAVPTVKYIITYGVLAWGILTGLLVSLFNWLIWGKSLQQLIRRDLWITLGTFMIGGIFFGYFMRKMLPKQIKKLKEKESLP